MFTPSHARSRSAIHVNHCRRRRRTRGWPKPAKRLIKNCIICWNYLYLSQKLAEIDDPAKREELLHAMAHGSAAAWGHLNLLGEYDFSEDKLQDSVGIKPPKLTD